MIRSLFRCALFIASLLAIPLAVADDSCSAPVTHVIYVNGIQNAQVERHLIWFFLFHFTAFCEVVFQ